METGDRYPRVGESGHSVPSGDTIDSFRIGFRWYWLSGPNDSGREGRGETGEPRLRWGAGIVGISVLGCWRWWDFGIDVDECWARPAWWGSTMELNRVYGVVVGTSRISHSCKNRSKGILEDWLENGKTCTDHSAPEGD